MVKKFESPLNNILKSELVVAQNQKKKHDKKPKDSATAQETLVSLKDCNHKSDLQTLKSMCDLMELYLETYEHGHKIMLKTIPNLMKYRTIVEIDVFILYIITVIIIKDLFIFYIEIIGRNIRLLFGGKENN